MRNLKVFIAYNGAAYHGFQRQDNAVTVQEVVEKTIGKLLKTAPPTIYGCSRTDAGVHARRFCFNVHTDSRIPCEGFVKGMNTLLPEDIAVLSCEDAGEDFHARYDTKVKEYVYLINNKPNRDVFLQKLAYHYPYPLDIARMNKAARLFIGEHDFAGFCRAEGKARVKSTVRTVYELDVKRNNGICEIRIRGNGFLYNMVRIVAGTLIYVSEGKRTLEDVRRAISTGSRDFAGVTLPPDGLYLNEVLYDEPPSNDISGLIANLGKLRTTELGEQRIRKNIGEDMSSVVEWAKALILSPKAEITRIGKNYRIISDGFAITVNAGCFTIITAHKRLL